ncbi:MAG: tetratricopeptide repeat protein [Gemmatimonadales bacterium]
MTAQPKAKMGTTAEPVEQVRHVSDEHPIVAWIQARQKTITIAVGSILVVALVVWYVMESSHRKRLQAMETLDQARGAMEAGDYPTASTGLQRVIQSFGGTEAAYEATLALNQVRLLSGQAELAVEDLQKFVATNPPEPFGSAAHSHLAMALENSGKPAEASAEYQKAAEAATEDYRKIDAYLNLARTYRGQGKTQEAIDVLRDVIKRFPEQDAGTAEARVRLAELTGGGM